MSTGFDALAIAVDWLDAYRSAKLDAILNLYDDEASLECGHGGQTNPVGKPALQQYWILRFAELPALELDDLQPEGDDVALTFFTSQGLVRAVLSFNDVGKITRSRCQPAVKISDGATH